MAHDPSRASKALTALQFAVAQEAPKDGSAASHARAAEVRTASGDRVALAAVAEDSSHGAAADWVIGQLFSSVREARGRQVGEALRRSLQSSVATVHSETRGELKISATAAVIWRGQLFISHTGHSAAFHVQGREVKPMTGLGGPRIGGSEAPWVESSPMAGRPVERGDRVVLVSDGLVRASAEDGRPFLDPKSMPEYVTGVPPLEAARHLISIALGRDAPEDLSVAVLGVPGVLREQRPRRAWRLALATLGMLAIAGLAATALLLLRDGAAPASDYGYAVLIRGELQAEEEPAGSVQLLEPIPVQSTITALQDSSLGLQSTFSGASDISATNLYLGAGARIKLAALDRRQPDSEAAATPTQIDLLLGEVLIVRTSGERDVHISALGGFAGLVGSGKAAFGVSLAAGGIQVDCLIGTCVFRPPAAEPTPLFAGQRLVPEAGGPQLFATEVHQNWNRLCAGCLSAP